MPSHAFARSPGLHPLFLLQATTPPRLTPFAERFFSIAVDAKTYYPFRGTLVVVDISTDDNYADIATRPSEFFSQQQRADRLTATTSRLLIAFEEWSKWPRNYFDRLDTMFSGLTSRCARLGSLLRDSGSESGGDKISFWVGMDASLRDATQTDAWNDVVIN